jgi:hypothetical protein
MQDLSQLIATAEKDIQNAADLATLEQLRVKLLGKKRRFN